jgi:hypothetical protein
MFIVLPDVVDGLLVNAAWAVAGMLAKTRYSRRASAALDMAGWADTEALIRDGLPGVRLELPTLSDADAAELAAAVERHEVQGALQALLAARLTDAPERDAASAREAVRLAIAGTGEAGHAASGRRERRASATGADPAAVLAPDDGEAVAAQYAERLSEYFDDKISALVAELEGRVGLDGLAQVRAEAYSGRIVALLGAIERQVAALAAPGRGGQAEAEWLGRYRGQARLRHGFLYPPDFDRRRKIPAGAIYVNTSVVEDFGIGRGLGDPVTGDDQAGQGGPDRPGRPGEPGLTVMDLAGRLDRTVLLGDPGGGKTTAANVLANLFASDRAGRIPFFITLREYAAKIPPQWSVCGYIEQTLSTLYQCGAPDGLVERLLLTGRAVVIFDGLDELLDASRRRDVSERVEQFCSAFPLTPVLVTSRVVGYNQARLNDEQFSCYRLGGFGDAEVAEYAGNWFATQDGIAPAESAAKAESFLNESANVTDLRTNPLLLSLMCILYRGAGSLPGDRAGIYARCAELMLRTWDEQRDLYRKLGTDHLVEPSLRYLAWWLFTREDSQTAATERELIAKTAEFLYGRGYETEDEARAAAREFVDFCRGRMWVFSDAGTTADGDELYGFTHRTFMEYFAAWHLAATSDTPEDLARALAPHIASEGWVVVGELAIKIKSDMSDRGADRIYAALLDPAQAPADSGPLLEFLAARLASARPAPTAVRALTRAAVDYAVGRGKPIYQGMLPLWALLANGGRYRQSIAEEMSDRIAAMVASNDTSATIDGLRLAFTVSPLAWIRPRRTDTRIKEDDRLFWRDWSDEQTRRHASEILSGAERDEDLRRFALYAGALTTADALAMPGGLTPLATVAPIICETGNPEWGNFGLHPYLLDLSAGILGEPGRPVPRISELQAIGRYLLADPTPPWIRIALSFGVLGPSFSRAIARVQLQSRDEVAKLGEAFALCAALELHYAVRAEIDRLAPSGSASGHPDPLLGYLTGRLAEGTAALPDLPVPAQFRQLFRDWAEKRVSFVEFFDE